MSRYLLVSNAPWTNTGYGTQAAQIYKQLEKAGHDVAIFANYGLGGRKMDVGGFKVFPGGVNPSGSDMITGHANAWEADFVIILFDAFAIEPVILRNMSQYVCFWQPIDCQPMSRADLNCYKISGAQPIAMAQFGFDMMTDAGLEPFYAPHGIDTRQLFRPAEQILGSGLSRQACREMIRESNDLPKDAFFIGMNVHNKDQDRKAIFEQMSAFALLHRRHPDTLLLCHSMVHPAMSGVNLINMADYLGITDVVHWADPYSMLGGDFTPQDMAKWYAQLDLLTGASRGEGFGLPLIEAQACGVPVVATDCSAMTELAGPGWLVSGQPFWQRGHECAWMTPDIGELLLAYEEAYDGGAVARSDAARLFGVSYDHDLIFQTHWTPILAQLEDWKESGGDLTPDPLSYEGWKALR